MSRKGHLLLPNVACSYLGSDRLGPKQICLSSIQSQHQKKNFLFSWKVGHTERDRPPTVSHTILLFSLITKNVVYKYIFYKLKCSHDLPPQPTILLAFVSRHLLTDT